MVTPKTFESLSILKCSISFRNVSSKVAILYLVISLAGRNFKYLFTVSITLVISFISFTRACRLLFAFLASSVISSLLAVFLVTILLSLLMLVYPLTLFLLKSYPYYLFHNLAYLLILQMLQFLLIILVYQ